MGSRRRSASKPNKTSKSSNKKNSPKSASKPEQSRNQSKPKASVNKSKQSKRISKKAPPKNKRADKQKQQNTSRSRQANQAAKKVRGKKITNAPQSRKIRNVNSKSGKFEDISFPPTENSLIGQYPMPADFRQLKWARISDVIKNPVIFKGDIEPNDIAQGMLGDCYFLAAIAALAQRPKRIENLFINKTVDNQMHFVIKMLYQGKWIQIDLDQWIVVNSKGQPGFAKSKEGQLWCILLEKAWAKLYSSFSRIDGGFPSEALHDLTGAPVKFMSINQNNKQQAWSYLWHASKEQFSVVAASNSGSDRDLSDAGIAQGHAYTVLNATQIKIGNKDTRVVQIRNPWGMGQSNIRLSDFDLAWSSVSQEDKKRVGFKPNRNDGIFFMYYDDFLKQFEWFQSVEVRDDAKYVNLSARDPNMTGVYFALKIQKQGLYCLQIAKPPQRGYNDKVQRFYSYPLAELTVKDEKNQIHSSSYDSERTLFHQRIFNPGTYIVKAKIRYNPQLEAQFDVNFAVYSDNKCQIQYATRSQAVAFQNNNNNTQWTGNPKKSNPVWHAVGNKNYLSKLNKK